LLISLDGISFLGYLDSLFGSNQIPELKTKTMKTKTPADRMLDLLLMRKECGFAKGEVVKPIYLTPDHEYDVEYLIFLKFMLENQFYCVRDFFCYANLAANDLDWMWDGHQDLFKGTRLEADKKEGKV